MDVTSRFSKMYEDTECRYWMKINRRMLERTEKVLGGERPDSLTSISNLATVLRYQEKYKAAEFERPRMDVTNCFTEMY